jgi:hypothetical protein
MTVSISISLLAGAGWQFFDNNGVPLAGGLLYTYEAGTTTPRQTYTDASGTTTNSNPIVLDSAGRVPEQVWLTSGSSYKFILQTSTNVTVWTEDNVPPNSVIITSIDSSNVTFIQAGTGAVTRTAQAKMRETVSVLDFGADPTGAADSTTAIQNAISAGHAVYFPAGTYLCSTVTLDAGTMIYGDGPTSIIKQTGTIAASTGSIYANSGSAVVQLDGIVIRDIRIEGTNINSPTFSEFKHLVSLNGVKNAVIENVQFVGFQGDGLYLGSGNIGGQERHNLNVAIRSCTFDGVNAENRNGISVIDGDTVTIEECLFTNTTKVGMPGSIDCEPDANAFAVIRNVSIRGNRFIGGNEAAIALLLQDQSFLTTPHENFLIEGNFIQKPKGFNFNGENISLTDNTIPYGVLFLRNVIKGSDTPFIIDGARGLTLQENTFEQSQFPAELGFTTGNFDCSLIGNTFYRCGENNVSGTRGLYIRTAQRITLENNSFVDCGRADGTAGRSIEFVSGFSGSYIFLRNNEFSSPTGRTNYVIFASGYTFNNGTNEDFQNQYLFVSNNDFIANYSSRSSVPSSGTWAVNNIVYNTNPASGGILYWVCTAAGSPGTWQAVRISPFRRFISRNYATSENFDASLYDIFSLNIQANLALTYNAPTGGTVGQELTIRVRNISGGAMGTITWDAVFKLSAWTNPANGNSRSITFVYDGTNWIQISQTGVDVPN